MTKSSPAVTAKQISPSIRWYLPTTAWGGDRSLRLIRDLLLEERQKLALDVGMRCGESFCSVDITDYCLDTGGVSEGAEEFV